jgi:hypothetical protein
MNLYLEYLNQAMGLGKDCPICLDVVKSPVLLTCTHRFCATCIDTWSKRNPTCPLCRGTIDRVELYDSTNLLILLCLFLNLFVSVTLLIQRYSDPMLITTIACIAVIIMESFHSRNNRRFLTLLGVIQLYGDAIALAMGSHNGAILLTRTFLIFMGLDALVSRTPWPISD